MYRKPQKLPPPFYQGRAARAGGRGTDRLGAGGVSAAAEKNRAYYQEHLVQNQLILTQLAQRLQNTILLQSDVTDSRTRAGALQGRLAWRAGALQDGRVFVQRSKVSWGTLSVDILLDGSASQNQQQEKLSTQAYLIAAALTRCQIPVRVSSFCSVSGCTVLRVFRDYQETGKNDAVFDYVSAGWNRDAWPCGPWGG